MELIYTDANGREIGVLRSYELDLAYGEDENDFECTIPIESHCCEAGCFLFLRGADSSGTSIYTEYGGIIDSIKVDTSAATVSYTGRTWHGILEGKILCPNDGEDYLTVSGEAHTVLSDLLERMGLYVPFAVFNDDSGVTIDSYQFDRYTTGYTGIRKMLNTAGAKLRILYIEGYIYLKVELQNDYSTDEEWDSSQMALTIQKGSRPVNHMICLGKGDLKDRVVIHLYADAAGNVSKTQTFTGLNEVVETYDYPNTESEEELTEGGTERLQEAYSGAETVKATFTGTMEYDIGDIVGARENITGTAVRREIVKKIIKGSNGSLSIEYQIGE